MLLNGSVIRTLFPFDSKWSECKCKRRCCRRQEKIRFDFKPLPQTQTTNLLRHVKYFSDSDIYCDLHVYASLLFSSDFFLDQNVFPFRYICGMFSFVSLRFAPSLFSIKPTKIEHIQTPFPNGFWFIFQNESERWSSEFNYCNNSEKIVCAKRSPFFYRGVSASEKNENFLWNGRYGACIWLSSFAANEYIS